MTARRCVVCAKAALEPGQRQTCVGCLSKTRSALMEVGELYALLPAELVGRAGAATPPHGGARSGGDGLSDVLVLAGPGSAGTNQVRDMLAGRDAGHAADELPSHPPSVVGELGRWEDDWRVVQRDQGMRVGAATDPATVSGCSAFLLHQMGWAAQRHDAFDEFAADMRTLVSALAQVTRSAPLVERGVPCPYCETTLTRGYAKPDRCDHPGRAHCDHSARDPQAWGCHGSDYCPCDQGGRRDDWRCPDPECGKTFAESEYMLAVWANWDDHRRVVESRREHGRNGNGAGNGTAGRAGEG